MSSNSNSASSAGIARGDASMSSSDNNNGVVDHGNVTCCGHTYTHTHMDTHTCIHVHVHLHMYMYV